MIAIRKIILILTTAVTAISCHQQSNPAAAIGKGQVIASVNGREITINELNVELSGRALPTGVDRKRLERAALQGLIARTILADIARDQKLDQEPNYLLQQHRTNELLLTQTLQRGIASRLSEPTRAEGENYIKTHPELFAERKIYALDQLKFRMPDDPAQLKPYLAAKSLSDIEQKLIEDRIPYQKAPMTLDVLAAEPELVKSLLTLPSGEIFLVPKGDVIFASVVTSTKVTPFVGPSAENYAAQTLQSERIEAATVKELDAKIKAGQATIKYQTGFGPATLAQK